MHICKIFRFNSIYIYIYIYIRIIKSRRLRWAGHVTRMGNERGAWKLLVGKPVGKRPVGRPRTWWENNIIHDREVDYTGDVWKTLAEDREVWRSYVHAVMNLRFRKYQ